MYRCTSAAAVPYALSAVSFFPSFLWQCGQTSASRRVSIKSTRAVSTSNQAAVRNLDDLVSSACFGGAANTLACGVIVGRVQQESELLNSTLATSCRLDSVQATSDKHTVPPPGVPHKMSVCNMISSAQHPPGRHPFRQAPEPFLVVRLERVARVVGSAARSTGGTPRIPGRDLPWASHLWLVAEPCCRCATASFATSRQK